MRLIRFATIVAASIVTAMPAQAQSLITNGDFESGTFAGWTVVNTGQSGNDFYVIANGGNVPVSAHPTQVNAGGGNFVAVSDQYGPGGEALLQSFTTTGGFLTLSFDWFNNTHTPYIGTEIDGSQQAGRVDILSALASPLSSTGVVYNFLLNAGQYTPFGTTVPWQQATFSFQLAPGTYQLRFGNGQCCYYQQFGVDNVSILSAVPEPSTWAMMLIGFGATGLAIRRRRKVVQGLPQVA